MSSTNIEKTKRDKLDLIELGRGYIGILLMTIIMIKQFS